MTQSTELALREQRQALMGQIRSEDFKAQLTLALPENVSVHRFQRTAVTALLENPGLAELERDSVFTAVLKSAADGLLPDGREAALVPFKGKAVYIPMIGGFRKIAAEHGWAIRTAVVYEGEEFDYTLGLTPMLHHRPAVDRDPADPIVAAYAIGRNREHDVMELEVMTAAEIEKVRKTSKQPDGELWGKWPERAAEKTVGRRLFRKLPLGDRERVRSVLQADELTPAEAETIVYGRSSPTLQTPAAPDAPEPEQAPVAESGEPDVSTEAPAAAFKGKEPPAPAEPNEPAEELDLSDAAAIVVNLDGQTRHVGETLGEIAAAGDRVYIEWLTTETIDDPALRAAAARVLEAMS